MLTAVLDEILGQGLVGWEVSAASAAESVRCYLATLFDC